MVFKYLFGGLSVLFLFSAVILPLFDDLPVNSYSPPAAPSIKDNAELIQSRRYFTQIKGAETIKISPKTGGFENFAEKLCSFFFLRDVYWFKRWKSLEDFKRFS